MIRSAILLFAMLQSGKFYDGYRAENHGVGIDIVIVHDGPRCRALANCAWMVEWSSTRQVETAEIAVTIAGRDVPVLVAVVPGRKGAKLDEHNPVFDVPLASVSAINITLRNGTKEVGHASF